MLGTAAVLDWIIDGDAPDLVKNLATTVVWDIFIPVVTSFFEHRQQFIKLE